MFRDVIEFAPDAIILATAKAHGPGQCPYEELFSYARRELIGQPWRS